MSEGLYSVWRGDVESGLQTLERALELAGEWTSGAVLIALVKAYEHTGDFETAHRYLSRYMANQRLAMARSIEVLEQMAPSDVEIADDNLRDLELLEARLGEKVAQKRVWLTQMEMLERMAVGVDLREEGSGQHGFRVGRLAGLLGKELGMPPAQCHELDLAARLHDIGKVGIPDRILLNSKELKDAERHFMSTHALIGSEMLGKSETPQLKLAEEIARCHHEWWNGNGYPAKKSGTRIPRSARLVALADVFDALTHGRPYQAAWPIERALAHIRDLRGEQFDPELTDHFLALVERLVKEHPDLDAFLGHAARESPVLQAHQKIQALLARERDLEATAEAPANKN